MSSCKICQSAAQAEFPAEIDVHFPGRENFTKPAVWLFPRLLVCLHCGFVEFEVEKEDLQKLLDVQESDQRSGTGQSHGS